MLDAVDLDLRFIDGHLLSGLVVRFKQVLQLLKPLSDHLMRLFHNRFDLSVRETSMIQKRREDMPTERRALTRKYVLLTRLLH